MNHDIGYYKKIQGASGSSSQKQTVLNAIRKTLTKDFKQTVNWELVTINQREQDVIIVKTPEDRIKKVKARPSEPLRLGEIVTWRNGFWMIKKLDVDDQIQFAGEMYQCNVKLNWQNKAGTILSQFGVSEDATKYSDGIQGSKVMQIGEFNIKVSIQVTADTLAIARDQRFLIGQFGVGYRPLAYKVTRVNPVTNTYDTVDGEGIVRGYVELTLSEDQFREGRDNPELGIADYVPPDSATPPPAGNVPSETGWF